MKLAVPKIEKIKKKKLKIGKNKKIISRNALGPALFPFLFASINEEKKGKSASPIAFREIIFLFFPIFSFFYFTN